MDFDSCLNVILYTACIEKNFDHEALHEILLQNHFTGESQRACISVFRDLYDAINVCN